MDKVRDKKLAARTTFAWRSRVLQDKPNLDWQEQHTSRNTETCRHIYGSREVCGSCYWGYKRENRGSFLGFVSGSIWLCWTPQVGCGRPSSAGSLPQPEGLGATGAGDLHEGPGVCHRSKAEKTQPPVRRTGTRGGLEGHPWAGGVGAQSLGPPGQEGRAGWGAVRGGYLQEMTKSGKLCVVNKHLRSLPCAAGTWKEPWRGCRWWKRRHETELCLLRALSSQKGKGGKKKTTNISSSRLDEGHKFVMTLLNTKQVLWTDRSGCSGVYTTLLPEHRGLLTGVGLSDHVLIFPNPQCCTYFALFRDWRPSSAFIAASEETTTTSLLWVNSLLCIRSSAGDSCHLPLHLLQHLDHGIIKVGKDL